jgi:hypothetical protein
MGIEMIYSEMRGGFCNLLFQFSAMYSFSRQLRVECSFTNFYEHLKYLNEEDRHNPTMKHAEEYIGILSRFPFKQCNRSSIDKSGYWYPFEYTDRLPNDGDFFFGYFQSEKYFNNNKEEILAILCPNEELQAKIEESAKNLPRRYNAIHVRLGDYLKFPEHHINLSVDYFHKAIEEIEKESDLPFVIFSDSIDVCKDMLAGKKFVFSENTRDYIELYLISNAENTIISNSSFGWWGAWIGEGKGITKKIVSPDPKKWLGSHADHNNMNTKDLIPDRWRKIQYD